MKCKVCGREVHHLLADRFCTYCWPKVGFVLKNLFAYTGNDMSKYVDGLSALRLQRLTTAVKAIVLWEEQRLER